jgi:tetratricopeptide (TPR) repeat protein
MHLFGRERERAAITEALGASRVVVLVGPPGIGKSALAASFCVDRPALWIDASGSLAAETLESATTGRRDAADLVVIDDVAADESPERIQAVIERALVPALLTSRRPLGGGLTHLEIPPLSPEDGAALLRSRITHPGRAAMTPTAALRRLSMALGGVPGSLCQAAGELGLLEVPDLLALGAGQPSAHSPGPGETRGAVLAALARLKGPVTVRLLSRIAGADAREAAAALVSEGLVEVYPSGAATVRLCPLAPAFDRGGEDASARLRAALAGLLPEWEALAREVEPGGWREQTARLREALPALEVLWGGDDPDLALRAACAAAVVFQRLGPERRILALDQTLPTGTDPLLAARWATFAAKAAVRFNDGPTGLAALDRRPAPADTLEAVDHASLRARLLELAGRREEGARLRAEAVQAAAGTALEGDVRYRDAVSRYWTGDFRSALAGLDRALACSDPEVHSLRVVKATILQTLLRRELGADSRELLAQMLPIDPLWRRTECEEGPTVVTITAALRADLGQWAEADALLAEAVDLFLRLGRRAEAANQAMQRGSLLYVSGRVPALRLPPALGLRTAEEALRSLPPFSRAEFIACQAVRAAALGQVAEARVHSERALEAFGAVGRPLRGAEVMAWVTAGLIGARAGEDALIRALLPRITGGPSLDRMRSHLLRALGEAPPERDDGPQRFELRILQALLGRNRGVRVAADGTWLQLPDAPVTSLRRKVVLKRALAALADAPVGLTLPELMARTWPDQRFAADSGRRRAEVAISNLRRLGLRDALTTVPAPSGTRWRLDAVVVPAATARR